MTLSSSQFYAYIFFEGDSERGDKTQEQALRFYEQWVRSFNLNEEKKENFPDYKDPDLIMLRLASGQESPSACLFAFGHAAIVEIEWQQSKSESNPNFWKKADSVLEEHLRNMASREFYIGCSRVCLERSDDLSAAIAKEIASIWGWIIMNAEPVSAKILEYGNFYGFGQHRYVLLSPKDDLIGEQQDLSPFPDILNFLNRDFPLMASALHKLEFEEGELRKLVSQNRESENEIRNLMKKGLQAVETHFEDIRQYQTWLRQTLILQRKLRQTLQINIRNFRTIGKDYILSENDSLFTPRIQRFGHLYRQIGYDLNYARWKAEEMESQIQLLELQISQKRLKIEQQFTRWIGLIGIPLGIGGATTNMENWCTRLPLMFGGFLFALCWCLWPKISEIIKRVKLFCKSFYHPLKSFIISHFKSKK